MAVPIFQQPKYIKQMSLWNRVFIFIIGVLETALWSGTIYGWASLVHILKTRGVFQDLCRGSSSNGGNQSLETSLGFNYSVQNVDEYLIFGTSEQNRGCPAQDDKFALMGTVAMVLYSAPGVIVGYILHHAGQAITRVIGSLMISSGFVLLSYTDKETPDYMWGGTILLAIGGNIIRVSCLEFGNLFPKFRNTMMAIMSSIYTISAALFTLVQSVLEAGYEWQTVCLSLAACSSMIILTTIFIPVYHIPYGDCETGSEEQLSCSVKDARKLNQTEERNTDEAEQSSELPLSKSVLSLSMVLLEYWIFLTIVSLTIFATYFNSWISKFAKTEKELAYYSRLFGYANMLCVFITPLPGLSIDILSSIFGKSKTGTAAKVATVQSMILPMSFVTLSITVQISCFFFFSSWAVYLGLVCLVINRPSCLGVGTPFVRARFPADHFNRLIGIQDTLVAFLSILQYLHFTWTQSNYFLAMSVLVGLLVFSLVTPLHLVSKRYLYKVLDTSSSPTDIEQSMKEL